MNSSRLFSVLAFTLLLCTPIISLLAKDQRKDSEAEKSYMQALSHLQNGENDQAIKQLKTALKFNRKLAKAYHQLALIYMAEGTVHGRFKATIEMANARKLEPKNVEFLFNDAILNLKKGFTYNAERQFKRIIELEPSNDQAYFQLAQLKEDDMLHYQDMISVEPGSDGIIFMQSFAEELKEKAADSYKEVIAINPSFADAYYRLALLFYEFNNYPEMIQLLESAVKIIPQDKNCHLFLGFAYQKAGNFQRAASEYQIAKRLMSPEELEIIESLNPVLAPDQMQQYKTLASTIEKNDIHAVFWRSKDPFYLTEVNERELEHFSRVAYANLRFSDHEKKIEGWKTDRGKVLIRYGKPDSRYRTRPYIGAFSGNSRNPLNHSKEFWIYPQFHFIFEDQFLSGNYTFAWGDRPENDYKEIYNEMIKKAPDYYKMIPDSQYFNVPLDIVAFQGQNGKTELELCYSIPIKAVKSRGEVFRLQHGIFLFDKSWTPVIQKTHAIKFHLKDTVTINSLSCYTNHEQIEISPGNYHFAYEFEDERADKRSKLHQPIAVDTFSYNKFEISDILFAKELLPPNLNVPPSRSDFKITPNPLRVYRKAEPVVVYFELYQLHKASDEQTRFKIEYQIGIDFQSLPSFTKLLTNIGLKKRAGVVTSGYEFIGESATELQYQKILLDPNMTGKIVLTVKATDLLTGNTAQKQEKFTIVE